MKGLVGSEFGFGEASVAEYEVLALVLLLLLNLLEQQLILDFSLQLPSRFSAMSHLSRLEV